MPTIDFNIDGKEYHAYLMREQIPIFGRDRRTIECVIYTDEPMQFYIGIAIKHPNDDMAFDEKFGYRLAFKRAMFQAFYTDKILKGWQIGHIMMEWRKNWDIYRRAFGEALHQYLKEDEVIPF